MLSVLVGARRTPSAWQPRDESRRTIPPGTLRDRTVGGDRLRGPSSRIGARCGATTARASSDASLGQGVIVAERRHRRSGDRRSGVPERARARGMSPSWLLMPPASMPVATALAFARQRSSLDHWSEARSMGVLAEHGRGDADGDQRAELQADAIHAAIRTLLGLAFGLCCLVVLLWNPVPDALFVVAAGALLVGGGAYALAAAHERAACIGLVAGLGLLLALALALLPPHLVAPWSAVVVLLAGGLLGIGRGVATLVLTALAP